MSATDEDSGEPVLEERLTLTHEHFLTDPNIVQYRGYARTTTSLYIVLEYCENGSLSAIIKKFGRIPESLVGLYTLQVLQGLQYLHDQGVIHRDIKGSNILATKEGSIKRESPVASGGKCARGRDDG